MTKPNIYLAGPMTGYKEYNFPAFFDYAEALEDGGWTVWNPAQHDLDVHGTLNNVRDEFNVDPKAFLRGCLSWDLSTICNECDAIAMMPGWENSKGARAEHATAVALGLQIIYLDSTDLDVAE